MRPVYQTRFGGPEAPKEQQGNCLQAALASIFEIPLEEAPDICEADDHNWANMLGAWLKERRLQLVFYPANSSPPPGFHLIGGPGPRGMDHVVVGKAGQMVHDPAPDGTGVQATWIGVFTCLDPSCHGRQQ